ncbi:MAG: hypothetical protein ABIF04_02795 [Chloroflexota bacterium]
MKKFQPTLEHALYAVAFAVAIGLRFLHLGLLPLSDYEADWALQSLRILQGLKPAIGSNPAYVHLTAVLFYIFGVTNFLARFWPALAGCALVLAPWLLRGRFGRLPALILSFGLAIDPGLVAMSHLAGGSMLAITFVVLTGLLWMDGRRALAGLFAGLALLSGPSAWFGLLGLMLAWAFVSAFGKNIPAQAEKKEADRETGRSPVRFHPDLRMAFLWGFGTLLVVGSLFVLSPKGLAAFVMSFVEFLRGWWTLSGVPLWQPMAALPTYEILPLVFGIAGVVRGILKRDADSIRLGLWALAAFVLVLIYPAKQTGDLAWALLPLWALSALEMSHHFDFAGRNLWEVVGAVALVVALMVFGWLNLASVTNMDLSTTLARTRLGLLAAVLFLIVLSLLLIGTGWSAAVARLGGVWGGLVTMTLFTIALATGTAGLRQPLTAEIWQPEPRAGRVDLILKVANQISDLNRGYDGQLPLTVLNVNSPALHWLFRDWQVLEVDDLAQDATPELIITPQGNVSLSAEYRGEALVLREVPDWDHAASAAWLKWLIYHQMPLLREDVILWARSDLMLDSQREPSAPIP